MKRKRDIKTKKVYKHKARLNVDGRKQEFAVNFFETFSPVVTWISIRIVFILVLLNNWHTRQIDFVLAYPQAPIEYDIYMELPHGIELKEGNSKTHVLKLLRNIYGQRQAGKIWADFLKDKLESIGFVPSPVDECVYIRRNVIFLVYVDDGIFTSPDSEAINKAIEEIKELGLDIDDQGDIEDYLGVNVERVGDTFVLTQPQLIDQIIEDLALEGSRPKPIPALSTRPLIRDENEPRPKDIKYNYRSIVGKLNFLEKSTRPDISYATHMVARFSEDHIMLPYYILVFVDADFSGNWNKPTAADDPATSKSRTGYVLKFTDCPLLWQSKLQTITALSSCESEYMALSAALRDAIFRVCAQAPTGDPPHRDGKPRGGYIHKTIGIKLIPTLPKAHHGMVAI
eukprot:scaffold183254_cov63-Attheya_sp.AAC.3